MSSFLLILSLLVGIVFRLFCAKTPLGYRFVTWGTRLSLMIVLLGLGISLGSQVAVWSQLKSIGVMATVFAITDGLGSAFLAYLFLGRQRYEK